MGGLGTAAVNLGKVALKPVAETMEEKLGTIIWKSMGAVLEESKIGTTFAKALRERYEPKVGQFADQLTKLKMNPDEALNTAKKVVSEQMFGKNKEAFSLLLQHARNEKGPVYADRVADAISVYMHEAPKVVTGKQFKPEWRAAGGVKKPSNYMPPSDFENNSRRNISMLLTSRIGIPHAVQAPLNNALKNGISNTIKGVYDVATDKNNAYEWTLRSGALAQELSYEYKNQINGKAGILSKITHQPLFGFERKWGITLSAVTGKHTAQKMAFDFFRSGGKDETSGLALRYLGQDLGKVMKQNGLLTEEQLLTASYRSASETMFLKSELQTPYKWHENKWARALSMYKDFGYNETRLVKNVIKDSARLALKGDMKPLINTIAVLGVAFPMAGEMVKLAENIVTTGSPKGNPNHKDFLNNEYADAMAHAAGFGIAYSMIRAATSNNLMGWVGGPLIGLPTELAQDMLKMRNPKTFKSGSYKLGRDITSKIPVVGPYVAGKVFPPKKHGRR